MAATKNKRRAEDEEPTHENGATNVPKKRLKYSEEDAQLAQIYNDLADEVQATRIKAASELLKNLSAKRDTQHVRIEAAETRLIKGLCSGRKAARLGFSIALAEVLRLKFAGATIGRDGVHLEPTLRQIVMLTRPEGNVSGQQKRDHLLGRRFAFQAVLQSDVGLSKDLTELQWQVLIQDILRLASEKQWIRRECGAMLYDYLSSPSGGKLAPSRVQTVLEQLVEAKQAKTPEGVGLWVFIAESFPGVTLVKGLWNHNDPLSSKERPLLSKIMLENAIDEEPVTKMTGSRQTTPSFAWSVVLTQASRRKDGKDFIKFWSEVVAEGLFSAKSSAERKSLGLQIFTLAIRIAPTARLLDVLHVNILRCILDQRAEAKRYLYDAAKAPLTQIVARAKQDHLATAALLEGVLERGAANFDQITKTKTVENIFSQVDEAALQGISDLLCRHIQEPSVDDAKKVDVQRRLYADLLLSLVRLRGDPSKISIASSEPSGDWQETTLRVISDLGYKPSTDHKPPFSESTTNILRSRLTSCLNSLLEADLKHAVKGPVFVVRSLRSQKLEDKTAAKAISKSHKSLDKTLKRADADSSSLAFSLLIALSILQVYNGEPDAVAALDDLIACYENKDENEDTSTTLIELLLSFISKPSALFRKLAEQVFAAFTSQMTADSLQSLTDILGQKESLSGQHELFGQEGEEGTDEDDDDDEDVEEIDVEDASDVELVNGEKASGSDSGSDSDEGDDSSDMSSNASTSEPTDNKPSDEEALFDRKLAAALGTAAVKPNQVDDVAEAEEEEEDHGSDMDDDQMLALEPHLTTIFRERRKNSQTTKKSQQKSAKHTVLHFKARVLDLLALYVKSQPGNILALDLILPLVQLTRTTSSKPTAEKAFAVLRSYFDAANKQKAHPRPTAEDAETVEGLFTVLAEVLEEMRKGAGAKLHASACSRGALFLSRVLVGVEKGNYARIAGMYAGLMAEWWGDGACRVQPSVFTEWTSWSIATRKGLGEGK